jgi:hypothetical protein
MVPAPTFEDPVRIKGSGRNMGGSRRSFLKLLGAATAGLAMPPSFAVVANNEVYVNKQLGVAFRIPQGWHFYTVHDMDEMFDGQILRPDAPFVEEYLEELRGQPLVSIGMLPPDGALGQRRFSPGIVLRLEANADGMVLENALDECNSYLERLVTGFRALAIRPESRISGYRALRGKYGYLFEAEDMEPTPIIGRSCIIEAESRFLSFNMYNHDPEDPGIDAMFDLLEASVVIL